jgi:hypothetical protein
MITKDHEPAAATSSAPSVGDVAARMPAERLEAEIVSRAQTLARGTYELLVHVAELDARGTWATWGALSCAAWLADACDLDPATANSHVRVARALRAHSVVAEALRAGQLSYSKVRALCPHLTDANAEQLVALARSVPAAALGRAIAGWSREHEDPEDIDARHRRDRSLRWRTDPDGMITITARLPPHQAAPVLAVIDQRVMSDRAPAGASLAQQRADALAAVATRGGAKVVTEVVIHVDGSAAHLVDGTPISDHAVAGLLPDAFVSLLLHDAHRYPIDASPRRRTPTRRQQRVVDARQHECAAEGCHARTLLQHDHIDPYAGGGPTVVANLQLLCGPHNRAKGAS